MKVSCCDWPDQKGQIIIILLMIMVVALALGLVVTQRSISDVAISTETDQASKSFSAAEAGLEKAFDPSSFPSSSSSPLSLNLGNESSAEVSKTRLPKMDFYPLEYPPIGKETIAQVWFEDPALPLPSPGSDWPNNYSSSEFDVYFGNPLFCTISSGSGDCPAIELNAILFNTSSKTYYSHKFFFDSKARTPANGFVPPNTLPPPRVPRCDSAGIDITDTVSQVIGIRKYLCKATVPTDCPSGSYPFCSPIRFNSGDNLVLVRIRLLYNNKKHPVAIAPQNDNLPEQATLYSSKGITGQTLKEIQIFKLDNVVPPWFDFAIFSAGDINKQ